MIKCNKKHFRGGIHIAESRLIGGYPAIGIRPTIDGRRGPLKVRESLEEQTMGMAQAAKKLFEACTGKKYHEIHMIGGGIQSKLLCQMTASACNRDVIAGPVEATALGNIAVQLITLGEIKDLKEARDIISRSEYLCKFSGRIISPRIFLFCRLVNIVQVIIDKIL